MAISRTIRSFYWASGLIMLASLSACESAGSTPLGGLLPGLVLVPGQETRPSLSPGQPDLGGAPLAHFPPGTTIPPGIELPPQPGQPPPGNGGASGIAPLPVLPAGIVMENGQTLALGDVEQVALPAVDGPLTILALGRIPATLDIPAGALPLTHPALAQAPPLPDLQTTLISNPVPNAQAFSALAFGLDAQSQAVAADGAGQFQLNLPRRQGQNAAMVVLRGQAPDRVSVMLLQLGQASSQNFSFPPVRSANRHQSPPAPPPNYRLAGSSTWQYRSDGMKAPLWSGAPGPAPSFESPLGTELFSFSAVGRGGQSGAEVIGPWGNVPAFPPPPELEGQGEYPLRPGDRLSWQGVGGAKSYTLRLYGPDATLPVWEGLSTQPTILLPSVLAQPPTDWCLRIDAWLGDGANPYELAQAQFPARQLRIPSQLPANRAARSWSLWGPGAPPIPNLEDENT